MGPDSLLNNNYCQKRIELEGMKVPLFDGTNFDSWKFRVEAVLDARDLLECVQRELALCTADPGSSQETIAAIEKKNAALKKCDKLATNIIVRSIADSHLEYAQGQSNAYQIWQNLKNTFQRCSISSRLRLHREISLMKFDPAKVDIQQHFASFDRKVREWKNAGATLDDIDVIGYLLHSMPASYKMVITAIETLQSKELSLSLVKNRLADETKKNEDETLPQKLEAVFYTQARDRGSKLAEFTQKS
jgi:hypothetical protein